MDEYEFVDEEDIPKPHREKIKDRDLTVARNVTRQPFNLLTRARGTPGDIATSMIPEEAGKFKDVIKSIFPTTEQTRKPMQNATGEYLKPQNETEKFVDDVVEDTAMMFATRGASRYLKPGMSMTRRALTNPFTVALGANTTKQALKDMGAPESGQNYAKMGSMVLLSMLDKKNAGELVKELYGQARANLPKNASVSTANINKDLMNFRNELLKGGKESRLSGNEKFVLQELKKIEGITKGKTANVDLLWAQKKSLNDELGKLVGKGEFGKGTKDVKKRAMALNGILRKELNSYGERNPQFGKPFKEADEAYGAIAQSNKITNWIENNLRIPGVTPGLLQLFGYSKLGGVVEGIIAPYHGYKALSQMTKSKTLREHYLKVMKAAAAEDSLAFNKELGKLNNEIQAKDDGEFFEFVD